MFQPCQQQNSEESDHFRRQERQPDTVQPKQARQCDSAGDDSDGPAQQRTGDGWFWLRDGGKIGNQQDVDASKEKAQEIQPPVEGNPGIKNILGFHSNFIFSTIISHHGETQKCVLMLHV